MFDIAIQYTGDVHNAALIAIANGLNVTDELVAGSTIQIPQSIDKYNKMVEYYTSRKITPATAMSIDEELQRVFAKEFPIQFS